MPPKKIVAKGAKGKTKALDKEEKKVSENAKTTGKGKEAVFLRGLEFVCMMKLLLWVLNFWDTHIED